MLRTAAAAGWLSVVGGDDEALDASAYASLIADLRNMLHPGRQLRSPTTELTEMELADARAALVLIEALLEGLEERS
jgi:hypothetical protein